MIKRIVFYLEKNYGSCSN